MNDESAHIRRLQSEVAGLRRALRELKVLNDLATEISVGQDLQAILQSVVDHALQVTGATDGVINLVEEDVPADARTLARARSASTSSRLRPDISMVVWCMKHKKPLCANSPFSDANFIPRSLRESVYSILCVPMMVRSKVVGILSIFNKREGGAFGPEDERLLSIIAMQSAQVIQNARMAEERDRVVGIFGQLVAPAIVDQLLVEGPNVASRRLRVCVMFLDIRGFSGFSERHSPERVVDYLNSLYGFMIDIVHEHGGTIRQLLGDGFMAMFGAPISTGRDSEQAIKASLDIVEELASRCQSGKIPPTRIGIGLHTGEVVAGTVGSNDRREYQITGDAVNLAARIEQMNKQFDSQILVSEETWAEASVESLAADRLGEFTVRGRSIPVTLIRLA